MNDNWRLLGWCLLHHPPREGRESLLANSDHLFRLLPQCHDLLLGLLGLAEWVLGRPPVTLGYLILFLLSAFLLWGSPQWSTGPSTYYKCGEVFCAGDINDPAIVFAPLAEQVVMLTH